MLNEHFPLAAFAPPRAAYVHVPFCVHRCGYCNFTVIAGRDDLVGAYLDALERELCSLSEPRPVDTLFLGGGTPTHLRPDELRRLLALVSHWFPLTADYEFSVEANPADFDAARAELLAEFGVNRVSLGVQSFNPEKLQILERDHGPVQIEASYSLARKLFASVSLDLIFGTPRESPAAWQADLRSAIDLMPNHVSTYGLTYERGTAFWGRLLNGLLSRLDEELERTLYGATIDTLNSAGFEHYEVSNFARPGHRCRHNAVYWSGGSYYAAGPGAARYVNGTRQTNHRSTTTYIKRMLAGESVVGEEETLSPEDRAREALVLGLRRMEGVEIAEFAIQYGYSPDSLAGPALRRYLDLGLLESVESRLRLTRNGLFISDAIWPDLLRR